MKFFSKSFVIQLTVILSAVLLVQSCDDDPIRRQETDFSTVPDPYNLSEADTSYTKEGGVKIYVIEEGVCPGVDEEENERFCEVVSRDQITLYLTGRTSEGEIFRSTYANGNQQPALIRNLTPVKNEDASPQVEGLRRGLLGMKEGEKRVIIVPPELGYDDSQPQPRGVNVDLRGKELRYDVELESIRQ